MSRAIKMGGAGGGSGSDDVTAAKAQLLENYTAITKDSDDEPGAGTMKHLTNRATVTHETANGTKVLVGDAAFMVTNSDGVHRAEIRYNGSDGYVTPNTLFAIPSGTMATAGGMTAAKVLAGQSAFGISGTATNDATATDGYVYSGKTYYRNGVKGTGTMTVGSILSFSAAAYSTTQILLTWQNPYAATGKPFSGVFINYSTSGYPGTGGTRIYTGVGSNSAAGGTSTAIVTMPSVGTTYYFSLTPYCTISAGDIWGSSLNATAKTTASGRQSFTASTTFTVPSGVRTINVHCTGGGGSGGMSYTISGIAPNGGGGGGGYTSYKNGISVTPGNVLAIAVGAGSTTSRYSPGTSHYYGGTSSVTLNNSVLVSAAGGQSAYNPAASGSNSEYAVAGGSGGSGGGAGGYYDDSMGIVNGGAGGSNGSGGTAIRNFPAGSGQGTSTQEFGTGTLYGGGGGGYRSGAGGAGGGGSALVYGIGTGVKPSGVDGTGGGGGGGSAISTYSSFWGSGGSGNVIITW